MQSLPATIGRQDSEIRHPGVHPSKIMPLAETRPGSQDETGHGATHRRTSHSWDTRDRLHLEQHGNPRPSLSGVLRLPVWKRNERAELGDRMA